MSFKTWAQVKEIEGKWNKTQLLESSSDKTALAMLLEGQRLYNEKANMPAQFNRISIPIAVRVFNGLKEAKIYGSMVEMPNWYTFKDIKAPLSKNKDLDEEAEQTAKMCEKLVEGIKGLAKSKDSDFVAIHCFAVNPDNTVKINYSMD